MNETTVRAADERSRAIFWAGMVWVLFVLASLNEIATTDPGVSLVAPRPGEILLAMLIGLSVAGTGVVANERASRLRPPESIAHSRRLVYSIGAGVAVGLTVLVQTLLLAPSDAGLRQRYAMFVAEPWWPPLLRAFSASVLEEVLFRYLGMAIIAVIAIRWLRDADRTSRLALVTTAVVFGVLHFPGATLAGVIVVLVNTAAGLLYGRLYWKWGIQYAIAAHFTGGLVNQTLGPRLIG